MQSNQELSNYLDILASIPDAIGWYVVPLEASGVLLLADSRESMALPLMEALAGEFGHVIATASKRGTHWAACLVDPSQEDLDAAAGKLRAAYAIGTTDPSDDHESGPF
ncbi:hypothetical protein FYK55_26795 [Roseiconus nitratireducens]|uniref:Uncharacterized protein n=1 Tax=Roseiconus nitratireducens TaxID=2605748 RepID=A0A5M6CUI1_9BACT|nr:hypothetical protein [Roseiconus nitratireducens]KAA5538723.1 hypothetical protein FYK55_26795 [Roseiconus nitratireducens]